jgi:hypothetical protein
VSRVDDKNCVFLLQRVELGEGVLIENDHHVSVPSFGGAITEGLPVVPLECSGCGMLMFYRPRFKQASGSS